MELGNISTFFTSLQNVLDNTSKFSIIHYPGNFIIAWIASYFSINILYFPKINTMEELENSIEKEKKHDKKTKQKIRFYKFSFAFVTAIAATALTEIQFNNINIPFSAIYGLMGPYSLREMFETLVRGVFSKKIYNKIPEIKVNANKDYQSELDKILQNELSNN